MSFEKKGSMTAVAVVTHVPDRSGNFVIEAGDDPAVVIETAWSYLNTFGGGTLVTKGAGQTWIFETTCDSQGDNVTWISDWSLTLQAETNLNDNVIRVTHDYTHLIRLHVDGNHVNQSGIPDAPMNSIAMVGADHFRIIDPWVQNAHQFGIHVQSLTDFLVEGGLLEDCDWNAVNTFNSTAGTYRDIYMTGAISDVGIGLMTDCKRILVDGCKFISFTGTGGFTGGGQSGIELFTGVEDIKIKNNDFYQIEICILKSGLGPVDIIIEGNTFDTKATGITAGIYLNKANRATKLGVKIINNVFKPQDLDRWIQIFDCYDVEIAHNTIECEGAVDDRHGVDMDGVDNARFYNNKYINCVEALDLDDCNDVTVTGDEYYDCTTGIDCQDGDDLRIRSCRFIACTTPIDVNNAAVVRPMIVGCDWEGCTNDPAVAGATNERVSTNIDKDGAWWLVGDDPA